MSGVKMPEPDADVLRRRERIVAALKAARGRSYLIEPEFCVKYLEAWKRDRLLWQERLESFKGSLSPDVAIKMLCSA